MHTRKEARMFLCPVDAGLALITGKWKPRILWKLYRYQIMRFSQFKRLMPDITDKMLGQQLRELEADGLITRTIYPVVPPKVEYTFTDFGMTLEPVIAAIASWGRHMKLRSDLMESRKKPNANSRIYSDS